jgi:hypothetical protein
MINKTLIIDKIELRFGREIKFSYECDELSNHIFHCTHNRISAQTLRRIFGFIKDGVKPSNRTFDYVSRYCGYDSYATLLKSGKHKKIEKNNQTTLNTIKNFFDIEVSGAEDLNYQRACSNIAKLILSDKELFDQLSGYLANNNVSQVYFFERSPYLARLSDQYLSHLKKYMQSKKTEEAQLFGNCLFFLSYFLRERYNELPKLLKIINGLRITDKTHEFPRARKKMSNILFAYCTNDADLQKTLTTQSFEEQNRINKIEKNYIFPFYHYIMADCFILIRDFNSAMRIFKIAELDYKSYNESQIEHGYFEHFDLMKAITYYNLGDSQSAKRILKRIDSSKVKFTMHLYHMLHRKILEYNLCHTSSVKKRKLLRAQIDSLIEQTGYTFLKKSMQS